MPSTNRAASGAAAGGDSELEAVGDFEQVGRQALRAEPAGRLDVTLGALAGVVGFGDGAEQRVAALLGTGLRLGQCGPERLELGGRGRRSSHRPPRPW